MSIKISISRSTDAYSDKIGRLRGMLDAADAVVIGAGAGLSTSAGFVYDGERFRAHFADFEKKYGFHDMYSGGFYPYPTQEEFWAYWSRYIFVNRYTDAPKPVYGMLLKLMREAGKDYFVITTNVDHCFQKAGIDKKRLFYTQGDYGLFQCSELCHSATYDNEDAVRLMVERQCDMRIPSEMIPRCPRCGRPMTMNLRSDDSFVEDDGWHEAASRYADFIRTRQSCRVLYLELGVGYNTPGIIKYPFWRLTAENPASSYACINRGEAVCPEEIKSRAVCIDGDIGEVLERLHRT